MSRITRKVLVVMRSGHLHTELVEVTATIAVVGDMLHPRVQGDLPAIEAAARAVMRENADSFGPWNDAESDFEVDFILCAPLDSSFHRGRIVTVEQVPMVETAAWGGSDA